MPCRVHLGGGRAYAQAHMHAQPYASARNKIHNHFCDDGFKVAVASTAKQHLS